MSSGVGRGRNPGVGDLTGGRIPCSVPPRSGATRTHVWTVNDTGRISPRAVLALCCYVMFTGSAHVVTPATSLTEMAVELGMHSDVQKGLFLSASFWGVAGVMLFSGFLGERLGLRRLLWLSCSLQFVGIWWVSTATDLRTAVAATVLIGLGRGLVAAPMTALLCSLFPERRTMVASLLHAFYYVGMIFILVALIGFHKWGLGWRDVYRIMAVLVLSCGFAGLFVGTPAGRRNREKWGGPSVAQVVRQPAFLLLAGGMIFSGITEAGPMNWVPYFVERAGGASRTVAIVGMLLLGVTMSIGRLTFGFVVERIGSARYFLIAGLLCAVSLMLTALPLGPFFSITCLIVAGLALAGNFPAILGGAADRFPDAGASMFAVLTMVAVIGAIIGPLSVGLVADRLGLRLAMASQALAPVSLIVLMAWFRRSGA